MAGIDTMINKKVFKGNKHKQKMTLETYQPKFPINKDNAINEQ